METTTQTQLQNTLLGIERLRKAAYTALKMTVLAKGYDDTKKRGDDLKKLVGELKAATANIDKLANVYVDDAIWAAETEEVELAQDGRR